MEVRLEIWKDASTTSGISVGVAENLFVDYGLPYRHLSLLSSGTRSRVVQLLPYDNSEEATVYLPIPLAMQFDMDLLLKPLFKGNDVAGCVRGLLNIERRCQERRAEHVILQRIGLPNREFDVSPSIPAVDELIVEALLHYFGDAKRYVAEGDVATVPLPSVKSYQDDYDALRYFKVVSVEPKGVEAVWVDARHTRISVKGGFCSGFLPPIVQERYQGGPLLPHWKTLAQLIAPAVTGRGRSAYRLGILLHEGVGKQVAIITAAKALGMKRVIVDCLDLHYASLGDVHQQLSTLGKEARKFAPCLFVLRHVQYLSGWLSDVARGHQMHAVPVISSALYDLTQLSDRSSPEQTVILVGTCPTAQSLVPSLRQLFTHEMIIPSLTPRQTTEFLNDAFRNFGLKQKMEDANGVIELVKERLPLMSLRDVLSISYRLLHATREQEEPLKMDAVEIVLSEFQRRPGSNKNIAEVPKVEWSDVGGLEDVKNLIKETVELPIKHRSLFAAGLHKRLGVLLYGPPGVGKTLLAKAIATECKTKFMSIKGPELLDMYVGETERLVRDLFSRAKKASPCVLFFDELDAFVPARGAEESGSVMDRVVSQFLAELDTISAGQHDVFVFGATNRMDLIDPALLRPGRLDKLVKVDLPRSMEDRYSVLKSLTRKFTLAKDVSLETVAEGASLGSSGADLYAICANAWMHACKRHVEEIKRDGRQPNTVTVEQRDFLTALSQ